MHQNNKTFLPNQSAHLSKTILFLNAGFLSYGVELDWLFSSAHQIELFPFA